MRALQAVGRPGWVVVSPAALRSWNSRSAGGAQVSARPLGSARENPPSRSSPRSPSGILWAQNAEELAVKFRIIIDIDEDGVFVATVPSLPGCVSQGASRSEALSNVREAIEGYLESLRERGEPIPPSIHEEVIDVAV
jgi:predicted RNase H-like HicB family nuclease